MGETAPPKIQKYINPLTVEAQIFLKALEKYGKTFKQVDFTLCDVLEKVVASIEGFLQQNLHPIVQTENTRLIAPTEVDSIDRNYSCNVCKLELGKNIGKAAAHLSEGHTMKVEIPTKEKLAKQRKEKRLLEKQKKANEIIKLPKKTKALFSNDLSKFFDSAITIAEKLKKIPQYDIIEKDLLALITPVFPGQTIKMYKFGSRLTGIGTANSDLDIFIDIGNTFNNFENRASPTTIKKLLTVRDALRKHPKEWSNLLAIENARVPILKVLNIKTDIEIDFGFSNSLGFCNTKLLEYLFDLQPIARRMCIFQKKWLERSRLNDSISTYSMSLMVIYFLQINKYLPSIEHLQFGLDKQLLVGPWIANFIEKTLAELNINQIELTSENFTEFMRKFFVFYSEFNFAQYAVCPFFGKRILISQIEMEMPDRYKQYVEADEGNGDRGLQIKKSMVVQDPIQLNHNVTKAVVPLHLKQITEYLKQSAVLLTTV